MLKSGKTCPKSLILQGVNLDYWIILDSSEPESFINIIKTLTLVQNKFFHE